MCKMPIKTGIIAASGAASIIFYVVAAMGFADLASATSPSAIVDGVRAADALAEKLSGESTTHLALLTAIVAMGMNALTVYFLGRAMSGLREDLAGRPCWYQGKNTHDRRG